jgi:hypothetical protein
MYDIHSYLAMAVLVFFSLCLSPDREYRIVLGTPIYFVHGPQKNSANLFLAAPHTHPCLLYLRQSLGLHDYFLATASVS